MHVAPPATETYGDLAAHFASDYGLTPDPWQQLVLDDWLAQDGSRYASLTCGLAVPRQNGKNGAIEVRELFGMVGRGERILHTAHEVKTARKAFKRLQHFFGKQVNDPGARFPELNALVVELRNVNGQEAIILANGGSVEIVARSKGSGRGFTVDVLVMDEAQDLSDEDLEALMPTTSAAPLGNPQWIFTGTPPKPGTIGGEVFTRVRTDALSGKAVRTCWSEWSIDSADLSDVDLDDVDIWEATNPALGERLQLEVIEGERGRFSDEGFARERLGWWKPNTRGADILAPDLWAALSKDVEQSDEVSFSLEVALGRGSAVIGAAWQAKTPHVEVAHAGSGTEWVVDWLTRATAKRRGSVVIDGASEAASFIPALEAAGVTVHKLTGGERAQACGAFYDLASQAGLSHDGDPALAAALAAATWKTSTEGARTFSRRSGADIAPLYAVTFALFGLGHHGPSVYETRAPLVF